MQRFNFALAIAMDIKNPNKDFKYKPLDTSRLQIRLLRKESPAGSQTIQCKIRTVDFSTWSGPTYKALSYTWGEPNIQRDRHILIDGKEFMVRENLYCFLQTLPGDETLFWIDQICIDQSNVLEQNHQVQFMSNIYRGAAEVVVWLGSAVDGSNYAMNVLDTGSYDSRLAMDPTNRTTDALFQRPYWKRLWVIQEIMLARSIVVQCGTKQINWSSLEIHFLTGRALRSTPGRMFDGFAYISSSAAQEIVRARDSFSGQHSLKLSSVLADFSEWNCSNPRDKVYGLLGLVDERLRVEIDYQKSVEEVLVDVVRKIAQNETFMSLDSHIELAETLQKHLGAREVDIHQLVRDELAQSQRSKQSVGKSSDYAIERLEEAIEISDPVSLSLTRQPELSDRRVDGIAGWYALPKPAGVPRTRNEFVSSFSR